MSPLRAAKTRPDAARLSATLDQGWDDVSEGGGAVAIVVLGFAFLAGFTLVALLFGLSAVAALLLGWAGSLSCVVLAVLYGAWREFRAAQVSWPRTRDGHVAVWDADLSAERRHTATIIDWDEDAIIDALPVREHTGSGRN
jgi:hypothetical protein